MTWVWKPNIFTKSQYATQPDDDRKKSHFRFTHQNSRKTNDTEAWWSDKPTIFYSLHFFSRFIDVSLSLIFTVTVWVVALFSLQMSLKIARFFQNTSRKLHKRQQNPVYTNIHSIVLHSIFNSTWEFIVSLLEADSVFKFRSSSRIFFMVIRNWMTLFWMKFR